MKTTNFVSLGSLFLATSFFWQDSTTQARPLNDAGISNASNDLGQVGPPRHTVLDFAPGTTQEEKDALRKRYLGPGSGTYDFTINSRWPGAMGDPIELTWSIVPDGVGNSTLISTLDTQFAAAGFPDPRAAWVQVMENAFARWDELTGVNFTRIVVANDADNGLSWGAPGVPGQAGDIRIRANILPNALLGTGVYPNAGFEAGEITLNSNVFWPDPFPGFAYIFENTMMHEIGHSLGIDHECPLDLTKLMEPQAGAFIYGPQHDDVRAAHQLYGDYLEPNEVLAGAPYTPLPTLINAFDLSDIDESMGPFGPGTISSGRLSIDEPGDVDVFRFQWGDPVGMQVVLDRVGLVYADDPGNCGPLMDQCCFSGNFTNSEDLMAPTMALAKMKRIVTSSRFVKKTPLPGSLAFMRPITAAKHSVRGHTASGRCCTDRNGARTPPPSPVSRTDRLGPRSPEGA